VLLFDSIAIDTVQFPKFSTPTALKDRFPASAVKKMDSIVLLLPSGSEWLQNVIVSARKKEQVTYDVSKIVSKFSRIIPGDQIGISPNGVEIALLKTPGVTLVERRLKIMGGGTQSASSNGSGPLLFIDGNPVPVNDKLKEGLPNEYKNPDAVKDPLITYLESLNPRNIDFIEVIEANEAVAFGLGTDGGVIYVHTTNIYREETTPYATGNKTYYMRGFSTAPIFTHPNYDKINQKASVFADNRTTIYWNGQMEAFQGAIMDLSFFMADDPADYLITVIRQTNDGDLQLDTSTITNR
jgi:hypothetical protein